jgi:hypothetical protein
MVAPAGFVRPHAGSRHPEQVPEPKLVKGDAERRCWARLRPGCLGPQRRTLRLIRVFARPRTPSEDRTMLDTSR